MAAFLPLSFPLVLFWIYNRSIVGTLNIMAAIESESIYYHLEPKRR